MYQNDYSLPYENKNFDTYPSLEIVERFSLGDGKIKIDMEYKFNFGSYPRIVVYKNKYFLCGGDCYAFGTKDFIFETPVYFGRGEKAIDGSNLNTLNNAQPFVLPDGRIIIFYRANSCFESGSGYSSIRMRISDTNGDNFGFPIKIFENYDDEIGHKGIWEPFPLLASETNGEYKLLVYLSLDIYHSNVDFNGFKMPNNNYLCNKFNGGQNIIYIPLTIKKENIDIEKPVLVFDSSKQTQMDGAINPYARPGMTVISKLRDGGYIMVFESSVENSLLDCHMVIQYAYSKDGYSWTNPRTLFIPSNKGFFSYQSIQGPQKYVKAAPYVVTLKDGRIVISLQSNDGFECDYFPGDARSKRIEVYISKEAISYSKNLTLSDFEPLFHHNYQFNEYGCWASLALLDDNLYVLSENGVNNSNIKNKVLKQGIVISSLSYNIF